MTPATAKNVPRPVAASMGILGRKTTDKAERPHSAFERVGVCVNLHPLKGKNGVFSTWAVAFTRLLAESPGFKAARRINNATPFTV